jgi:hypothetical protein
MSDDGQTVLVLIPPQIEIFIAQARCELGERRRRRYGDCELTDAMSTRDDQWKNDDLNGSVNRV